MKKVKTHFHYFFFLGLLILPACVPSLSVRDAQPNLPKAYGKAEGDSTNTASAPWMDFCEYPQLKALIEEALQNNQEINILQQEILVAQNEVRERKGEYLPFVNFGAGTEVEKVGEFTRAGAVEEHLPVHEDEAFPEPLPHYQFGAIASWELDVWKKLRTAKKAAQLRYLASVEGRNAAITALVAEIAHSYYELMALESLLQTLKQNIEIQQNALRIIRLEKKAARVTELAVRRFEAEVYKNQSHQYEVEQQIIETENRLNVLVGRYPQPIERPKTDFTALAPSPLSAGLPAQLLTNRPDIRQAELEVQAAQLDVEVARKQFYPNLELRAGLGYQAFNPKFLISTPQSLLYNLAGELVAPLVNRNALKAAYNSAGAKQLQAVLSYEQTLLEAYTEVANLLTKAENLEKSYALKKQQVEALTSSISIANSLFRAAEADYMEVLLTQRDALEAKMELIETQLAQLHVRVSTYRSLGGGWRK